MSAKQCKREGIESHARIVAFPPVAAEVESRVSDMGLRSRGVFAHASTDEACLIKFPSEHMRCTSRDASRWP